MECSIDDNPFHLTINISATRIALAIVVGVLVGVLAMLVKTRQGNKADGKPATEKVGRHLDEFLPKDVDDLVDTMIPHLLVQQRMYRRHRKVYGDGFEDCCTYVDLLIGKVSAALGPTIQEIRNADEDTEPMTAEEIGNLLAHQYTETDDDNITDDWVRENRLRRGLRVRTPSEDNSMSSFSESNLTPLSQGSNATVYRPMPTS